MKLLRERPPQRTLPEDFPDFSKNFGKTLMHLLDKENISGAELARKLGITSDKFVNLITGKELPGPLTLFKLKRIFKSRL